MYMHPSVHCNTIYSSQDMEAMIYHPQSLESFENCQLAGHSYGCTAAAAAKSLIMSDSVQPHRLQPTGLPIPGILQARTLEWVAISFSNA